MLWWTCQFLQQSCRCYTSLIYAHLPIHHR